MMVIGTLALTGFPLTAGYFSKDAIIEAAYSRRQPLARLRLRADGRRRAADGFYSWRLIFMTFHGEPRAPAEVMEHVHESPPVMLVPLYVLAAGALFAGLVFTASSSASGDGEFWQGRWSSASTTS